MVSRKRTYIEDMVDEFGYDYVIGYCLCSEYDLRNKSRRAIEDEKAEKFRKMADRFSRTAEQLMKERINNGL